MAKVQFIKCPRCGAVAALEQGRIRCPACEAKAVDKDDSDIQLGNAVEPPAPPFAQAGGKTTPRLSERVQSNTGHTATGTLGAVAVATRSAFQTAVQRRFRPATSWFDIFDWKFEKYLTPWIVRASWIVCLAMAFMWAILIVLGTFWSLAPKLDASRDGGQREAYETHAEDLSQLPEWLSSRIVTTIAGIMGICLIVFGLLWTRVVLEMVVVLFNIAMTLTSIDQKLEPPRTQGTN
jgi:hypothetical protein